jgi:hypothetical protein
MDVRDLGGAELVDTVMRSTPIGCCRPIVPGHSLHAHGHITAHCWPHCEACVTPCPAGAFVN